MTRKPRRWWWFAGPLPAWLCAGDTYDDGTTSVEAFGVSYETIRVKGGRPVDARGVELGVFDRRTFAIVEVPLTMKTLESWLVRLEAWPTSPYVLAPADLPLTGDLPGDKECR